MMRENAQTALAQTQKLVYLRAMEKCLLTLLFFACVWNVRAAEQTRQPNSNATAATAQAATNSSQVKKRLNQILYWQLADELKLSPKTEKEMVIIIEDIQARRESALKDRAMAFGEIKVTPGSSAAHERLIKAYKELSGLDLQEHQRLLKVLGLETLGRFYVIREKVAEKISHSIRETASK